MSLEEATDSTAAMDVDEGETMSEERPTSRSNSHSVTPNLFEDESTPPSTRAQSETPTAATSVKNGKPKKGKTEAQLIGHLPRAEADAVKTFEVLEGNHYQYQTLGRSREAGESMTCDCQFVPGEDDPDAACGEGSDCINRLTQVECVEGDCRCRAYCRNQRMQRKQYADIEIVLTEKKGFGLRAASDVRKDAFIYEYIGEVVNHVQFAKRMRDYAEEGLRHFYFMMLQKDEFIDATKKGGIGRFANHSCNPNCYVAKWSVGKHVRMGIYAKRNVKKDEELTFNYNVDRYGHDPQPCYCGESNCVGFLGGKTQTDVAAMDDLYLDALGITDEVETQGLKGSKKKKSKKLDEDYIPTLRPLTDQEVPKVIQAIRQSQSRKVLLKLFTRIKITEDQAPLRQLMRLRGYSVMCNILEDNRDDVEICTNLLDCILDWPLISKNKVIDSKIEEPVKLLAESEDEKLRPLAEKALERWSALEVNYRIPKRVKTEGDDTIVTTTEEFPLVPERDPLPVELRNKRTRYDPDEAPNKKEFRAKMMPVHPPGVTILPPLTEQNLAIVNGELPPPITDTLYFDNHLMPPHAKLKPYVPPPVTRPVFQVSKAEINVVIEEAKRKAEREREEAERRAAEEAKKAKEEEEKQKRKNALKAKAKARKHMTSEEKEALKEKRLLKLVGAVVVKCMSKYAKQMDRDTFKKHAKELTQIIADKEKRSQSYQTGKLDALSEEKVIKIKKFSKEYIAKLLHRMEKSGAKPTHTTDPRSRREHRHDKRSSKPTSQPDGPSGSRLCDELEADLDPELDEQDIDINDTLDLGLDDYHDDLEDYEDSGDPSPATDVNGPEPTVTVVLRDSDLDISTRHREKYLSPSTPATDSPASSKGKRSRWDQKPHVPSVAHPESLYDGL